MATNLVAVFKSIDAAERARELLLREGVARNAVHLTNNESLMSRRTATTEVTDTEHRGFFSRLFGLGDNDAHVQEYSQEVRNGSALLTVVVDDATEARRIEQLLSTTGGELRSGAATGNVQAQGDTLKVMEEELQVGKRTVETGAVRIRQHVTERPVHEQIQLCEEHAVIQRVPVNRAASPEEIDRLGMQDQTIEIRERAEQAVVAKTARVVEEVRVGKEVTGHTEEINDTVRRTDVDVEQLTAAQQAAMRNNGNTLGNTTRR